MTSDRSQDFQPKLMKSTCLLMFVIGLLPAGLAGEKSADSLIFPSGTNTFTLRIHTNASPDAMWLFNSFDLEMNGKLLFTSPHGDVLKKCFAVAKTNDTLSHVLVNGFGPELAATNSATIIDQASGTGWQYLSLDLTPAYASRVSEYQRGIVFISPDLLVIHDHVLPKHPATFQMQLHLPAGTQLDPDWKDLRLDIPGIGLQVTTPSRKALRVWEIVPSPMDEILSDTLTARLVATNKMSQIDLVTVFAVQAGGLKRDHFAFKLVESNTAIGARIHRDGLPTLVAFRLNAANAMPSLDTFKFSGPVGVSVFKAGRR